MATFIPFLRTDGGIAEQLFTVSRDLAPVRRFRIAAAVVETRSERIVSLGHAHYKTHPFQSKFSSNPHSDFWHAETHAIYNATRQLRVKSLEDYSLYVVRAKRDTNHAWHLGCVAPCDGCRACIDKFKLDFVYYSDEQ